MPILIDGHVHIHPEFSLDHFFSAAWTNFSRAAESNRAPGKLNYVLALTEGEGCDVFATLKEQALSSAHASKDSQTATSWNFFQTTESDSLIVRKDEAAMLLVAGRQLVSKENIELLSLLSSVSIKDRSLPLDDLARAVADNGGLPVVPWGVGKWFAKRGKVVEHLLHGNHDYPLFFGDNGNRPLFWPEPTLLKQARDLHVPVLSGSDPLPLPSHTSRPGSFGALFMEDDLSTDTPLDSLRKLLTGKNEITGFGRGTGSFQFIVDQLQINLRKQLGRKSGQ